MVDSTHDEHIQIISRYTDQPDRLPAELRRRIEDEWGGKPVQLYAVVDLDSSLRLSQTWVALGPDHIATVSPGTNGSPPRIRSFDRSRIRKLRERPCLSCTVLTFVSDAEDEPVLAVVRYTHRQRRAMENIKFVVEQQIAGHSVEGADPDTVYAESMARDVEEAQASVSVHRLAVIWRLLAYLKPYRKMLALGTLGAVVMTLTGLVPPYLTGKLIDDVLKPAQAGTLAAARAAQIAWLLVAGIGVTYVVRQFSAWLRLRTLSIMGEYVARDLRTHLYEHVQSLSLTFFSSKKTGSIISRVSNDTDRLWDFIAMGAVEFTLSMVMLVCLGGVLMHLDLQLGLIMTVPIPVMFGCIMLFSKRMNRLFVLAFRKWSGLTEILSDTIPGIRVVKAFNQERREIERFGAQNYSATGSFAMIHSTWTSSRSGSSPSRDSSPASSPSDASSPSSCTWRCSHGPLKWSDASPSS
jgi:ATP-binding cassette subfamily B protein